MVHEAALCHLKSFSNSFELTVTRGSESSMPLESLEVIAYPGQAMVAMCCNLRGASNCHRQTVHSTVRVKLHHK